MARIWGYFRSWGNALTTSGLWVVIVAVAGVVFVMWLAGTGFLPTGKKAAWQPSAKPQPAASSSAAAGTCRGRDCPAQGSESRPIDGESPPPGGRDVYRTAAAQGYDAAPEGACSNDEPPPWGAPEWKNCGVRCMYERLRNGFCGPGCDYYYFRLKEYKPRRFYPRKPCYRVP